MTRCAEIRAARTFAALASVTGMPGVFVPSRMTEAEVLRIGSRMQRNRNKRASENANPGELQNTARQRRRARQTHPGKR